MRSNYPITSTLSLASPLGAWLGAVTGLPGLQLLSPGLASLAVLATLERRSMIWVRSSDAAIAKTIADLDNAKLHFAAVGFRPRHATFSPFSRLWGLNSTADFAALQRAGSTYTVLDAMFAPQDSLAEKRRAACEDDALARATPEETAAREEEDDDDDDDDTQTVIDDDGELFCVFASVGHPRPSGAAAYARAIENALRGTLLEPLTPCEALSRSLPCEQLSEAEVCTQLQQWECTRFEVVCEAYEQTWECDSWGLFRFLCVFGRWVTTGVCRAGAWVTTTICEIGRWVTRVSCELPRLTAVALCWISRGIVNLSCRVASPSNFLTTIARQPAADPTAATERMSMTERMAAAFRPPRIVARDLASLRRLWRAPLSLDGRGSLSLEIPSWPRELRAERQREAGELLFSCGCVEGAVSLVLALTLAAALVSAHAPANTSQAALELLVGLAGVAIATAAGKFAAIALARLRLAIKVAHWSR